MAAADEHATIVITNPFQTEEVKKQLLSCTLLAVDIEFVPGGNGSTISLIQISTPDKEVFLFDVQKCSDIPQLLRQVLESPKIRKVMHACKNDSKVLWGNERYIKLNNVFDTQLLHQILTSQKENQPINKQQAGLEQLCTENAVTFDSELKQLIKGELKQDKAYFEKRDKGDSSIPTRMREYAVQDVTSLIDLYNKMKSSLGNWVEELYDRLINVNLYADLEGVDNRHAYIRDKGLLGMVAQPQILTAFDAALRH